VITPPRRSVTRFFIPLIDVLILLFCIFLLMPFVSGPPTAEPDTKSQPQTAPLPDNVRALQAELKEARDRLTRIEQAARAGLADRISVRVLQVGQDRNGVFLYYFDPERQDIRTAADALKLITHQKALAIRSGGIKDVMFLVLYPRDEQGNNMGYPTRPDVDRIRGWFGDVPLKFQ
jgi:hypothetical protein